MIPLKFVITYLYCVKIFRTMELELTREQIDNAIFYWLNEDTEENYKEISKISSTDIGLIIKAI